MKKSQVASILALAAFASACASGGAAAGGTQAAAKAPVPSQVDAVPVTCPAGTDSMAIVKASLKDRTLMENRLTQGLLTTMKRENFDATAQREILVIVHVSAAGTVDRPVGMGGSSGSQPVDDDIKSIAKAMTFDPATKCTIKVGSPYQFTLEIDRGKVSFQGNRLP